MKGRRIDDLNADGDILVLNELTKNWEVLPQRLGVYTWDSLAPLGACRLEMHSVRIVLTHSAQISSHDMSEWVQSRPVHA